jgi:hypothetical protein
MSDRRLPVKAAALLAPLVLSILTLHAWGDALSGGLGRAVGRWQYPERDHAIFQIRVPRRSDDVDQFAARALQDFLMEAIRLHGRELKVKPPTEPIKVVVLDFETDVRRYRWSAAEPLVNGNEGLYDPVSRTIYVRMEQKPKLQQEAVSAALRQSAAHALLYDAGAAAWSPWLLEGMVGRLEGARIASLRGLPGSEFPTVTMLLTARPSDFQGMHSSAYTRGAKLFTAFLQDTRSLEFAQYYEAVRDGQPEPDSLFSNPTALESDWKKWLQDQK